MLIVVPPSESKRPPPDHGSPVVLGDLSFPELNEVRTRILDALIATSARADAFERLRVGPSRAREVARNTWLHEVPAMPVLDVYAGPLHVGLDAASFSAAERERAGRSLIVTSVLWGLLRPADRIPPYRMHPCARLVGIHDLHPAWRAVIGDPLARVAGPAGIVVDLRSPGLQAMGSPTGLGDRTVAARVDQSRSGGGRIGDVVAKRIRGQAARLLLETGADPADPDELAGILAARWPVHLSEPDRPGRPWSLTLFATD